MVPRQVVPDRRGLVEIGKIKENLVTEVIFDCADLGDGSGAYAVVFQRPKGTVTYPVAFRAEWPNIIWVVQAADTAKPGTGKVEIRWYGDGYQVGKSKTFMVRINDGLPDPTEAPQEWAGYIGQVAQNAKRAETAASKAETAAKTTADDADAAKTARAGAEQAASIAVDAVGAAAASAEAAQAAQAAAAQSQTAAGSSAAAAASSAQAAADTLAQVKDDLAAGKLKGEKGDPGTNAPQIDDNTVTDSNPWSSKKIIDTLCPALDETGNPVTCYPVAGYPLGVVAQWEPTQEGSGEPYPAGGGPQLLDISRCTVIEGKPYGLTITIDGDIIKCSGVPSDEVTSTTQYSFAVATSGQEELRGKGYKVTAWPIKGKVSNAWGLRTADESSLAIAAELSPGVDTDIQLRLMVSKDTPTAYAPYENIRPISGREAVKVERCGENLLKIKSLRTSTTNGGCTWTINDDGSITVAGKAEGGASFLGSAVTNLDKSRLQFLPAGSYFIGGKGANVSIYYYGFYTDGMPYSQIIANRSVKIEKDVWITVQGSVAKGKNVNETVYPYIVPGTTAPTAYTPYQGDTLALQLPGTVYGGEVDAVTGEGTKNWERIVYDGTEAWSVRTVNYMSYGLGLPTRALTGFCTHFKKILYDAIRPDTGTGETGCYLEYSASAIFNVPYENLGDWKNFLAAQYAAGTPVCIVFQYANERNEPFTATGAQPIPALAGCNTVLTDADSVTVTGRADPAHAIAALQAQLAVATQQLEETQAAMVDTTAMAVDYIYEQDLEDIGLEEVDESDNQTDTEPVDVPGV